MRFQSILNARDLGGLPAAGGRPVRSGRLLRSALLHDASDEDIRILSEEYRLRKIFDFRSIPENEFQPDRTVPGAEHILIPTLDQEAEKRSGEAVPAQTWLDLPKHIVELSFTHLFKKKARELYPSLIESEYSQLQYAAFLNMILDTPDGAVLWHCSQGKDRTGIGAALILGALGVDRQTIIDDFALSYEPYRPLVETLCEEAARLGAGEDEFDVIRAFMGVSVRNFTATMDLIDSKYGGMHSYLTETLLLSEEDLETLRTRYLELP